MIDEDETLPPVFFPEDDDGPSTEELRHHAPRTTDAANADAIVREHGRGYRYVLEWDAWIAWDGKRWGRSGSRQALMNAAVLTARKEHYATTGRVRELEEKVRMAALQGQKDDEAAKRLKRELKLLQWHEVSQNAGKIEAAIKILETRLQVTLAQLDRDPLLLNLRNGTLDLRNAEIRPHDRDDLITQITDVEWDDDARCPTWDAFVSGAMGGKLELVMYLQRLIGYSLTGQTTEHILVFFFGGGQNGKSTFVQTIRAILGEYACAAPRSLLFEKKQGDDHPAELARLYGKRFAVCAEIGEHTVLDEAKVKDLTGGDAVGVRRMREDFWDLLPTHKLIMSGNHKPTVRGADFGIWRRIRLVPWLVQVAPENVDKDLPAKLRAEAAGILRWAAQGCLEWRRIGLHEPDEVAAATAEYRDESDAVGQFLAQFTVGDEAARTSRKALREKYEEWCKEAGYQPHGAKRFSARVKEVPGVRRVTVREAGTVRDGWAGIRLRSTFELTTSSDGGGGSN